MTPAVPIGRPTEFRPNVSHVFHIAWHGPPRSLTSAGSECGPQGQLTDRGPSRSEVIDSVGVTRIRALTDGGSRQENSQLSYRGVGRFKRQADIR